MTFRNRAAAGLALADALAPVLAPPFVVGAIPRGGVTVALPLVERFHAPLALVYASKLTSPVAPEFAFGALDEDGEAHVEAESVAMLGLSPEDVEQAKARVGGEIQRRMAAYGAPPLGAHLPGPGVVLVDDGARCLDILTAEAQRVNYRPGIPRYLQIAYAIRQDLRGEGERISSEHAFCKRFKVSRPTIRQALDVLVEEGLLYRHAGRGTFSTPSAGADPKLRVIGSGGGMMALGGESWVQLGAREIVPVPANIAHAPRPPPRSSVYQISGVPHADNGPLQHLTPYVP